MQAAIFMDQERAHDETRLMIESAKAVQRREDAFEALHEVLVSKPKVFEVPAQTHQTLRSIVVGEIGVENDGLGERTRRGPLRPQGTRIELGVGKYIGRELAKPSPDQFFSEFLPRCRPRGRQDNQGPAARPFRIRFAVNAPRRLGESLAPGARYRSLPAAH